MKIKRVHAIGCNRFALNPDNASLVFEPDADIQLILGSNGSGKSSLAEYCLLVIPERSDFKPNGGLDIELEHQGTNYQLLYDFACTSPYQFLKETQDGYINLNENYKLTTQKELIAAHLGLTPSLQSLLLGKENFTDMPVAKRKQWFIQIADTHFEYAMTVWEKLNKAYKEHKAAAKVAKEQLLEHKAKVLDADKLASLNTLKTNLEQDIETYLKAEQANTQSMSLARLNELLTDAGQIQIEDNPYKSLFPDATIQSLGEALVKEQTQLASIQQQLKSNEQALSEVTSQYQALKSAMASIQDDAHITQAKQELLEIKSSTQELGDVKDASALDKLIKEHHQEVTEAISNLIPNLEDYYNKERYQATKQKLVELESSSKNLLAKKASLETKLQDAIIALKEHQLNCPNCNHRFSPGIDPQSIEALRTQLEAVTSDISQITKKIQSYQEYVQATDEYLQGLKNFQSTLKAFSSYPEVIKLMTSTKDWMKYPASLTASWLRIKLLSSMLVRQHQLQETIDKHHASLQLTQQLQVKDLGYYQDKLNTLQNARELLAEQRLAVSKRLNDTQKALEHAKSGSDKLKQLSELLQSANTAWLEYQNHEQNQYIQQQRKLAQVKLAEVNKALMDHLLAESSTAALQEVVNTSSYKEKSLKLLADGLSPTKGLIAQGLSEYINVFLSRVNEIIAKTWVYPLKVNLVEVGDEFTGLNYYLPFTSSDSSIVHDDISEGSLGMRAIIDLAFKIATLEHLKLVDYPLVLDEFGANFDKVHRERSADMIQNLMQEASFPQLLMVSHFVSSYGSFVNGQKFVLDASNIDQ